MWEGQWGQTWSAEQSDELAEFDGRALADSAPEDAKSQSSKNLVGQFQVVGTLCYDENTQGTDEVIISEWRTKNNIKQQQKRDGN